MAFLSCKKMDTGDSTPIIPGEVFPIPASTPVNGAVSGRVLNENNIPVSSAAIECAGIITNTDVNGFFNINQATLDKYISTVVVTKTGYFKAYRSFSANTGRNFVEIKLIPKTLTATVSSVSPVTVTLPNSTEIRLQPNSMIVKSTGIAYNGSVNVYASYIDPTRTDIGSVVPGSFIGKDNNNLYALQSTGMIAVDIESASGEPLQLAVNMPASIKLPIPVSLAGNAPSTIDTWSLDDKGVWKKEGTATRSGNFYDMPVSHFSFWNCDVPMNAVYLSMHVQDREGNSITNTLTQLKIIGNTTYLPSSAYGFTDGQGNVSGFVPAAVQLELNLLSNNPGCMFVVYSQIIGIFNANTSLTITATLTMLPGMDSLRVSGLANDCSGQPLQNGTALIYSGQYYKYASIINGSYSTTLLHCTPIDSVRVLLNDNLSAGIAMVSTVAVSGNSVTIPATSLCLNMYDGIYEVTGTFSDIFNTAFTSIYPKRYHLITAGPVSVFVGEDINAGIMPAYSFMNSGAITFYGSFGIQLTINPSSNTISELHNYYGDPRNPATGAGNPALGSGEPLYAASNSRRAVLDPSGLNIYDPSSRVFRIKYLMSQPSVVTTGFRAFFDETWTYIGPR
jgi:hypothetical protein